MVDARGENGFSLLEALVALSILALLILPLSGLLNSGVRKVTQARALAEATSLLQQAVEEVKQRASSGGWDDIVPGAPANYPSGSDSPEYQLQIVAVDEGPDSDAKWVTLSILDSDGSGIAGGQVETRILLYNQ